MIDVQMPIAAPNTVKEFVRVSGKFARYHVRTPVLEGMRHVRLDGSLELRDENRGHQLGPFPLDRIVGLRKKKKPVQFLGWKVAVFGPCPIKEPERNVESGLRGKGHGKRHFSIPVAFPMIQRKSKHRVKERFTLMRMTRTGALSFLPLLAIGWGLFASPLVAQQPPGDFAAGIYAYQQKDYATAYSHLSPLAAKGHSAAQYNLGRMYARGEGVPQDVVEAYKWFFLAHKNGRVEGEKAMTSLAKHITQKQISEAIGRAHGERYAIKR